VSIKTNLIDALAPIETALVQVWTPRATYGENVNELLRACFRRAGGAARGPNEAAHSVSKGPRRQFDLNAAIGVGVLDELILQRMRALGFSDRVLHRGTKTIGPEWVDLLTARIQSRVP